MKAAIIDLIGEEKTSTESEMALQLSKAIGRNVLVGRTGFCDGRKIIDSNEEDLPK